MCLRETETDAHTVSDKGEEAEIDEADTILQRPVMNRQSVKMCIVASNTRIEFIKTKSVEEVLLKYPYLKEADLVSKDTSTPPLKYFPSN